MMVNPVAVTESISFGGGAPLVFIAGPCVIENEGHTMAIAGRLREIFSSLSVPFIFKASFDKANRTSIDSYRGPGLEAGLKILARIRHELRVAVTSDIHLPTQAEAAGAVLDMLQIPAFLCRQTDLVLAASRTGKPVNIKKGQFLAPEAMDPIARKIRSTGNDRILFTERGTTFGYQNLVVDFRSIPKMQALGYPVVFDVTHSLQLPGQLGEKSGGDIRFVAPLAKAGVAAGADGIFLEVHEAPEKALSDGPNTLPLDALPSLVEELLAIRRAASNPGKGPAR
jgi:2-dehydro-3-deoxyphosphooctonate aldolase (KDO 8-P synthase)